MSAQASHDTATPTLSVLDPRGLVIRSVGYCRQQAGQAMDGRMTRQVFDVAQRLVERWDPRRWDTAPTPNLVTVYTLSGQPLLTDSVDAGWQLKLLDEGASMSSMWDSRGSQQQVEYDELRRPLTVTEQTSDGSRHRVECLTYGGPDHASTEHNQCARLIRHDDPAGTQHFADYSLGGEVMSEARRVLRRLETPDWPSSVEARDALLEARSFVSTYLYTPTGEVRVQTDAGGNVRTFSHTVAGALKAVWLKPAASDEPQWLVNDICYNAMGQVEREVARNGVVTTAEYAADDGRLVRLLAAVHGAQKPLQDLNYSYDPVGNILKLEDKAQAVSHFNNQRIEPITRYRYDSLYQLVEARGWEVSSPSHGPALPGLLPLPLDPNQKRTYTQTFDYDRTGNLMTRHHSGAPSFSMFTSATSNRSLAQREDGSLPGEPDIALGFDANGNQRELQRGQAMHWDTRNQLSRVTLVKRDDEPDDDEAYVYDRPGHRLRKVNLTHTGTRALLTEVRYLPGLEIHVDANGQEHHVIGVETGRNQIRLLHWPQSAPEDVDNNQLRYSLSDHLGSSTLELDAHAGLLTQEHYYPFGGTACWAGKSASVAKYKTIRYSGKERDATGLYYYGYRYCAPWLQRWLSADPAGVMNGLNVFCFVGNGPVSSKDIDGRIYEGRGDRFEQGTEFDGFQIVARGLEQFSPAHASVVMTELSKAEHAYADAQSALKLGLVESADVFQSYFGPAYAPVVDKVVESWARGERLAKEYQGGWGPGKFMGVRGLGDKSDHNAFVNASDFHGRMAINVDAVGSLSRRSVIGHELMHLTRVNRLSVVGPSAVDHFYLDPNGIAALGRQATGVMTPSGRDVSEIIMQGGLTREYYERFTANYDGLIAGVDNFLGRRGAGTTANDAVQAFNSSPVLRAQLASENADSLIYAANSMQGLYRDRLASSRQFYDVLNS